MTECPCYCSLIIYKTNSLHLSWIRHKLFIAAFQNVKIYSAVRLTAKQAHTPGFYGQSRCQARHSNPLCSHWLISLRVKAWFPTSYSQLQLSLHSEVTRHQQSNQAGLGHQRLSHSPGVVMVSSFSLATPLIPPCVFILSSTRLFSGLHFVCVCCRFLKRPL